MRQPSLAQLALVTILVAAASIIYELLLSQALTIILGGTVLRYSITIGIFLFALGLGTLLFERVSQYHWFKDSRTFFVIIEFCISFVGMGSVIFVFLLASMALPHPMLALGAYACVALIGLLSGLEIPLLVALSQGQHFSKVLSLDYLGSLIGSVLFGIYLYPELGLIVTSIFVGALNFFIALYFSAGIASGRVRVMIFVCAIPVSLLVVFASQVQERVREQYQVGWSMQSYYKNFAPEDILSIDVLAQARTHYQEIVFQRAHLIERGVPVVDTTLFLNKSIQLNTRWITEYHEAFALGGIMAKPLTNTQKRFAVLGGGDFILINELLKDADVARIDHVDIDKKFIDFIKANDYYSYFNKRIYEHPLLGKKIHTHITDAYRYMRQSKANQYDTVFLDLATLKKDDSLLHLYSQEFFASVRHALQPNGQLIAWMYSDAEYQSILKSTLRHAGFTHYTTFCARLPMAKDVHSRKTAQPCIQAFIIATTQKGQSLTSLTKDIARLDYLSEYQQNTLQSIPPFEPLAINTVRSNSIFRPNMSMVVQ